MISFSCREATTKELNQARAWHSPALSFCDAADTSFSSCQTLIDSNGAFCGLLQFDDESDLKLLKRPHRKEPHMIYFHLRFSPNLSTATYSRAVEFALRWLRKRYHPSLFLVNVYSDELYFLDVYKRLGFLIASQNTNYIAMELDDRPYIDASMPLQNGMTQYEGDPPFCRALHAKAENSGYNVSLLSMCAHTGTHIDTPAHVGLDETDAIDLSLLNGFAQIIDWSSPDFDAVQSSRVLLANTRRGLTLQEAERFIQVGVVLVGIDRLSVGFGKDEWSAHQSLLQNGVIILENAVLKHFSPGFYQMRCLPLSIPGSDGLPVRLLLREELQ